MRLAVICPHFAPDVAPTGEVMTSIALELAHRGHRLHVVTSLPWYRHHAIEAGWNGQLVRHEDTDWGRITRIHPFPTDKRNIPARAVAFGGFTALAMVEAAIARERPDAVLAMSPPLTLGLAGWSVARARRVPFVFNIQDVFPDVAVELGLLTDRRVIAAASWLERFTYRRADAVTVLSDDLADNVRAKLGGSSSGSGAGAAGRRGQDDGKVVVIPNFIDTDWMRPGGRDNAYRREFGLTGQRVVMYAGNVGLSQSLDLVLDAAAALAPEEDVTFVINGGGAARAELQRRAAGLGNVRFVDMQPKARLPEVLAAADLHVVPLRRGLARSSVPSKLYSILAAGRPIVASVDAGTEVARVVDEANAGLAVAPDDNEAFTKAVRRLLDDPDEAVAMGRSGRRWVERWLSPAAVAQQYDELLTRLVGDCKDGLVSG
jgi:colanic acid biosynthesis glycosyl transferase WcaI